MLAGYVTIQEMSKKWGITPRRIQVLCVTGRIEGAEKFGRAWAIPANAKRPTDGRVTTGEYMGWRKRYKKPEDDVCDASENTDKPE